MVKGYREVPLTEEDRLRYRCEGCGGGLDGEDALQFDIEDMGELAFCGVSCVNQFLHGSE
jgi:hypothetical protein